MSIFTNSQKSGPQNNKMDAKVTKLWKMTEAMSAKSLGAGADLFLLAVVPEACGGYGVYVRTDMRQEDMVDVLKNVLHNTETLEFTRVD